MLDNKSEFEKGIRDYFKRERDHEKDRYEKALIRLSGMEAANLNRMETDYPKLASVQIQLASVRRTCGTLWPAIYLGKGYEVTKLEIVFVHQKGFCIEGNLIYPVVKSGKIVNTVSGPAQWNLQGHYLGEFSPRFCSPKNLPIGENYILQSDCQ